MVQTSFKSRAIRKQKTRSALTTCEAQLKPHKETNYSNVDYTGQKWGIAASLCRCH